ncbi:hypothetical protein BH10PLA2_BH10PLA2_26470 [soil metagenome]
MKSSLGCNRMRVGLILCTLVAWTHSSTALAQSNGSKGSKSRSGGANAKLSQEAREVIAWAAKNYRIEIVWKNVPYPIALREERKMLEGTTPTKESVDEALVGLKTALAKYPKAVPHAAGLFKIMLGANLKASGVHIGGYSHPPSRALILEIENEGKRAFHGLTMHHEIFHLIDRAILGQFARQDLYWMRLNGPAFKGYQVGDGWNWMANQPTGKAKPVADKGFVSPYSMSSVQEDKAEVFGLLMEDPAKLTKLSKEDPVIRAKADRIKQLVHQASPRMDHKFFEKLAAEKTSEK